MTEITPDMTINEIQKAVFEEYVKNGYYEMWSNIENQKVADIAELGLIGTEVSETMEEIRSKEVCPTKVEAECADIIIRVLNFMTRNYLDPFEGLRLAHATNLKRGKLHGKGM